MTPRIEPDRDAVTVEFVAVTGPDEVDAFIGIGASGRTEPFDIHAERKAVAAAGAPSRSEACDAQPGFT